MGDSDSGPSFKEHLEEFSDKHNLEENGTTTEMPDAEKRLGKFLLAFVGGFLCLGFAIGFNAFGNSGATFIFGIISFILIGITVVMAPSVWKGLQNEDKHIEESEVSRTMQICPACGWQNTSENNFCNDCGQELT